MGVSPYRPGRPPLIRLVSAQGACFPAGVPLRFPLSSTTYLAPCHRDFL